MEVGVSPPFPPPHTHMQVESSANKTSSSRKWLKRQLSNIYQSPVFLVFGQNNGHYSTDDSLKWRNAVTHSYKNYNSLFIKIHRSWQAEATLASGS